MSDNRPLLEIINLSIRYRSNQGIFNAVKSISFSIERGKTFGLVGESGSGKSSVGKAILCLIPKSEGIIKYDNKLMTQMQPKKLQMIFQDPYSSINPRMQIVDIIREPLDIHKIVNREFRTKRVKELLSLTGLSLDVLNKYPTELSGGQRQRVGIARTLAINPEFIFCDEPTSSLDAYHEQLIIKLLQNLQSEFNLTYLFVSHNLSLITKISHEIGVMYRGEIVEKGTSQSLISERKHPYTQALFSLI